MLSTLIVNILKMNFKESYGSWFLWAAELVSVVLSLAIYFFTSKLFSTSIENNLLGEGVDYFTYIVWNDILLILPLYFLEGGVRLFKKSMLDDTLTTFLSLGISKIKIATILYSTNLIPVLLRASLTFALAYYFFSVKVDFYDLIFLLLTSFLFIPLFLGIGLFVVGLVLMTGRGGGLTGYLCTILTFFGGGFFPLEVLPDQIVFLSKNLNPFAIFLDMAHLILFEKVEILEIDYLINFLTITAISIPFFVGGITLYFHAFKIRKRGGKVQLFIR